MGVASRTTTTGASRSYIFTEVAAGGCAVQISGIPTGTTFSETVRVEVTLDGKVAATLEDALGNRRIITMEGGSVNPLGTLHVDAGVPGLQFDDLFRDRPIFNGAIGQPWPSSPPNVVFAAAAPPELTPPSGTGFVNFAAATRILRLDASGTACATSGYVPIQNSPVRELPRTVSGEGPVSEG